MYTEVSRYLRANYAITAGSSHLDRTTYADLVFKGQIAQIHAYSILGSRKGKGGVPELELRNPWGRLGLLRPGAPLQDQPDGTFWMPASAFAEHFTDRRDPAGAGSKITVAKVASV